jgi:hypothetical protein
MKYLIVLFLAGCASHQASTNHVSYDVCEEREFYINGTKALGQDRQGFIDSLNDICGY